MTPAEALREKLAVAVFPDDLFGENCYLIRRRDTTSALAVDPGLQVEEGRHGRLLVRRKDKDGPPPRRRRRSARSQLSLGTK